MYTVNKKLWSGTSVELQTALDSFVTELEDHKQTVGVPAPLPAHEFFYEVLKNGSFQLENEIEELPPEVPTTLRPLQIVDRLTDAEVDVVASLASGTAQQRRWWLRWTSSVQIDTTDPQVIGGFQSLFGVKRAAELLSVE